MRRTLVLLTVLALAVRLALALPVTQPGYMDEAYYFVNATTLASGGGLSENFVWNYLAHPQGLPQPSNAYWMPLTSLVLAPALWLFGMNYRVAQLEMLALSALLVPLTYVVSLRTFGNVRWALTSAALMLASSFYLPYWAASDSFTLYALLGTGALLLATRAAHAGFAFAAGLVIGLAQLTRADGILLFVPFVFVWWKKNHNLGALAAALVGYALVMLPWFARNLAAFGAPLVGGGTIFMREYNDLFLYEQTLSMQYWLAAGWEQIAHNVGQAFVLNLATLAGALHFVFAPFALVGMWRERLHSIAQAAGVYGLVLFVLMTFPFSLSGPRGTFLHSLVALLPLGYVFAPVGLHAAVEWIARHRQAWRANSAERVFGSAFVLLAAAVSLLFYRANVFGDTRDAGWNERFAAYADIANFLERDARDATSPIFCIAPPAFVYVAHRAALAIPSDDPLALVHAGQQFAARYVIVEPDHPRYMDGIYNFSIADGRFQLLATFTNARGAQVQLYQLAALR